MHYCSNCKLYLDDEYFYTRTRGGLTGYCKKCTNKLAVSRINEKRRELKLFAINHSGSRCQLCKFNESLWALCFHHLDPNKKELLISEIKNKDILLKELEKCILTCINCHFEIHEGMHPHILKYTPKYTQQTIIRRQRKHEYIEYLGGSCKKCKYNRCDRSLNFHHFSNKDIAIGRQTQLPKLEDIKVELDKCILLCGNCHSVEHQKEYEKEKTTP